jgi:hypothetical protein
MISSLWSSSNSGHLGVTAVLPEGNIDLSRRVGVSENKKLSLLARFPNRWRPRRRHVKCPSSLGVYGKTHRDKHSRRRFGDKNRAMVKASSDFSIHRAARKYTLLCALIALENGVSQIAPSPEWIHRTSRIRILRHPHPLGSTKGKLPTVNHL